MKLVHETGYKACFSEHADMLQGLQERQASIVLLSLSLEWFIACAGSSQGAQAREVDWRSKLQEKEEMLASMQGQLAEVERDKEEASAAAQKFEADLKALSQAYGDLEIHAHSLESQQQAEGNADAPCRDRANGRLLI